MRRIFFEILLVALGLFATVPAFADIYVRGTISDSNGEAIVGASVLIAGTQTGVSADTLGNYSINIPSSVAKPSLVFACLGFKSVTVPVGNKKIVNVVLEDDVTVLSELVVIGFGSARRGDITGAVSTVKFDEQRAESAASLDQLIKGNAAGVYVVNDNGSPDAGVSMTIRGAGSMHGSNEPLYVIDGILLNPASETGGTLFENAGKETDSDNDAVNGLMGINQNDIADIQILKDASATAIYGSLGANGVVLITTKTAAKEKPSVTFSANVGISHIYKEIDVLSFDDYVNYRVERGLSKLSDFYTDPESRTGLKVQPMNWQKDVTRPAVSQSYNLSISGKPRKLSYLFSLGYKKSDGVVQNTDASQLTLRLNLDRKIGKILTIGTRTSMGLVNTNSMQSASASGLSNSSSFMKSIITYRPYMRFNDDDDDDDEESLYSPYRWLKYTQNKRSEVRVTPSVYLTFQILPWLSFKSTLGGDFRNMERTKFKSSKINRQSTGSVGATSATETFRYNWDNVFMFDKVFARQHSINGSVGMTLVDSYAKYPVTEAWNIQDDAAMADNISGGKYASFRYSESRSTLLSFFARGIYNYANRYVLTATCRFDGSSKFQGANKWSVFPSFAAAWRLNNERWFRGDVISNLKLRAGWGQVGNQSIPSYRTLPLMTTSTYADHSADNVSGYNIGLYPSYLANPNLKWETTQQWNAGLDFGILEDRLSLVLDFYDKTTFDLLQQKSVSYSSGSSYMWVNDGAINNRGVELTLDALVIKLPLFKWSVGGNISFNRNSISSLGECSTGSINLSGAEGDYTECSYVLGEKPGSSIASYPANIYIVGKPMGLFYGLKTDGIVQEDETGPGWTEGSVVGPGHVRYCDLNGNGYIDVDDRTIIGDPNPDFTYAFNTTLTYRHWRLYASFNGSHGNDVFNVFNITLTNFYSTNNTNILTVARQQAWTPENKSERYPAYNGMTSNETSWISDRFVEDGSYLRLAYLSLSYEFVFGAKSPLRGITLTAYGNNLWFWSAYSGWNPEVNTYGDNMLKMGIDAGSYPSARTFGGSVKFTF